MAIADVNNDGMPDLFVSNLLDHNQLFVSSDPAASYRSCRLCPVTKGVAVSGTGRSVRGRNRGGL